MLLNRKAVAEMRRPFCMMNERLLCGQTSPMLMQRHPPCLLDRVTDLTAAAQHDFPKPDFQIVQMSRNPIRAFAALPFYVSHADEADIGRASKNP